MCSQFLLLEHSWQVPRCLSAVGRMRLRRAMCWHGRKPYVGPVESQSGTGTLFPYTVNLFNRRSPAADKVPRNASGNVNTGAGYRSITLQTAR